MRRFETIRAKFIVLLASVIVVMLGTNMLWQHYASEQSTERELLDQARALSSNMDAVWTFMTRNQDLINYDSAGNYEFKGVAVLHRRTIHRCVVLAGHGLWHELCGTFAAQRL